MKTTTIPPRFFNRLAPICRMLALPASLLVFSGAALATITIDSAEPSTDVLLDAINGGSVGTLINSGAAQGARGTEFVVGVGGESFDVNGFTIQANNADTFGAGETLTVAVYSGTAGTFTAAGSFANVTPAYLDTNSGLTLIGSEAFTATAATGSSSGAGAVASNEYVTFNFTTPINLDGGVTYTAFVFADFAFSQREGNNNGGGRISFSDTTTALTAAGTRDLRFSVLGTSSGAGFADPTISASDNLITAGDPVDLSITFDTSAESAELATPGGAIDLLAIDAGDGVPNDGMVVVNDSPANSFLYEVTATKTGSPDGTASDAVVVSGLTDAVVYEDNFDNDGVGVNTGAGGGGVSSEFNSAPPWVDDGALTAGTATSGGNISTFNSLNGFNITDGFVLEVVFDLGATGGTPFLSNHLSFGLLEAPASISEASALFDNNDEEPTVDGIGMSFTERNNFVDTGIIEWDGFAGTTSTLSPFTPSAGVAQTLVLGVEPDGSFVYSYGSESGAGTSIIDLNIPYFFQARTQGSSGNVIQSVTLHTSTSQFLSPTITSTSTLIEVGGSIDLDITFDTSSDTASLTTPGGAVDLIALDGSDTNPNDGMVTVVESPTSNFTYEVTATKSGSPSLSSSVDVVVVDPSTEAPDNDFSTAIKADGPLFYYRFEEGADPEVLLDSSGNSFHVTSDNILGGVTFGSGPGGMQNAGDFGANTAILVPTSSAMDESYTFSAVINLDESLDGPLGNILTMANGTGIGRSLFYYGSGGFQTFADGNLVFLSDADAVTEGVSCLVHVVFDSDPDDEPGTLGTEMRVYVNGTQYGSSTTLNEVAANTGDWILASNKNTPTQSLLGWLDEVAVFESELTDTQISDHATAFFAAADPLLGFFSDTMEVVTGDPVVLSWKVSDLASVVTLNGAPVDGAVSGGIYTTTVNPTTTTTYTLDVDGETREITVTVLAPPVAPTITSISADGSTPPMITIEIQGTPNTTFDVRASADLVDGFPFSTDPSTITTNGAGFGTVTFEGFGTSEYYRIETIDP
ncbi:LamG-like jellyroll fold domain-containing protein [Haloferula sp.]|uniref:LamG-like jellyroll fold domain-containing protein n=1 Tax=Haloferula sp. TaxID=2497595 RepID=UPI00329ACA82